MSTPTKCPVCNSVLKVFTMRHINSKKHQDALKKAEIEPSQDPALELLKVPLKPKPEVIKEKQPEVKKALKVPEVPRAPKVPKLSDVKRAPKKMAKIKIAPLKLAPISLKRSSKEIASSNEYASEEDLDLNIPMIPEPPKRREKLVLDSKGLTSGLLDKMKKMDSNHVKVVLINCDRCKEVIPIPVPKRMVLESDLPVVPISFIHKNAMKEDQHCITIHLDHDFDIRRQRISDVIISER